MCSLQQAKRSLSAKCQLPLAICKRPASWLQENGTPYSQMLILSLSTVIWSSTLTYSWSMCQQYLTRRFVTLCCVICEFFHVKVFTVFLFREANSRIIRPRLTVRMIWLRRLWVASTIHTWEKLSASWTNCAGRKTLVTGLSSSVCVYINTVCVCEVCKDVILTSVVK